jgi:RNA polymerase sigma-70 factor (ECF subfamily)
MIMGRMARTSISELEALYRSRYERFVRVATAILRNEERAVEAVQEAFALALRDRGRFRGEGPLEAWVWRIVVNCARRARVSAGRLELLDADLPGESEEPPDVRVREAVARLPERQRLVLFLRYYADLDYVSIATAVGIRPGTVAAALHAAHVTLRESLQEVRQ